MIKLVHGSNESLSFNDLIAHVDLYKKNNPTVDLVSFDLSEGDIGGLQNLLLSTSLFAKRQCLIVKRLSILNADQLNSLAGYLISSKKDVILWYDGKLNANTRFFKAVKRVGEIIESIEVSKKDIKNWTKSVCDREGVDFSDEVINCIISSQSGDPSLILQEIKKLSVIDNLDEISVRNLVTYRIEGVIWTLIDFIENRNIRSALNELLNLLNSKVDSYQIFYLLVREFRLIFLSNLMKNTGCSFSEIVKNLKVPPFVVSRLLKSGFGEEKLKKIIEKLLNIDFQVKKSEIDMDLALIMFLNIL